MNVDSQSNRLMAGKLPLLLSGPWVPSLPSGGWFWVFLLFFLSLYFLANLWLMVRVLLFCHVFLWCLVFSEPWSLYASCSTLDQWFSIVEVNQLCGNSFESLVSKGTSEQRTYPHCLCQRLFWSAVDTRSWC